MKKLSSFISVFIILVFVIPSLSSAEQTAPVLTMEELSIQIMPEYSFHPEEKKKDQPPLLVGLHGTLMNKSGEPQKGQIEIPLPLKAKDFRIGYVADYNRDQTKMNEIEYEINKSKGTVSWTTTEDVQPGELYKFVIEYYSNDIKMDKQNHKLSYKFVSFADIGMLRILFLEPLKTESFSLTPAAESHQENGYGMNMFMYQIQGMKPGETKEINLKYVRTETKTTMDIMNEMGDKTAASSEVKENKTLSVGIIIGSIAGISIVVIFILTLLLKRRTKQNAEQKVHQEIDLGKADDDTKKKRLRGMLLNGSITEDEYQQLLNKLTK